MISINFNSENLVVDWISFNIQGLIDPQIIAHRLIYRFNSFITFDNQERVQFSNIRNNYNVSLRQYTSKWVGTQIIFSGKDAAYFYNLIKTQEFDLDTFKFDQQTLSLGRIDLCFSRTNDSNNTTKSFDAFLVDSRSQIQNHTNTRHIKLQDFPDGKMLKVNRRNNSLHYRVYQKNQGIRFELEFKHRQTKLVQDYLFNNQLNVFEYQLVIQYFKYSGQVLRLDYPYTDWIVDFKRRYQLVNSTYSSLLTSYLENQINSHEEEEILFHLLQFLSFVKSLNLNPTEDCQKHWMKKQLYYILKFPLAQFINFTGVSVIKNDQRKKILKYFKGLQKLDPIVKEFSDGSFQSYVSFPYTDSENRFGNSWVIEVFMTEELFNFSYPFRFPKSFLSSRHKNDLRLKVRFIKSLAVSEQEKTLDIQAFFNTISVPNNQLIQIKKNILQLLKELVENKIIHNELQIIFKSGKKTHGLIKNLTTSDITRRIKYIKLNELLEKL